MRPLQQKDVYSIEKLKSEAKGFFFAKDTMHFWQSRVSEELYRGQRCIYFVTSEKAFGLPRSYTVRRFDLLTRSIDTVKDFARLTRSRAHTAAKRLATNEGES